jgi:calcineurin-like phosphoesterase family protein
MNYYISDLHLCHQAAIGFDNRPFANLDEMHKKIIDNWNNVIKGLDNVYILGDVGWKQDETIEIIKKMKGKKHLILGNHD